MPDEHAVRVARTTSEGWQWIKEHHLSLAPLFCALFGLSGWGAGLAGWETWRLPLLVLAYLAGGTQSFLNGLQSLWQRRIDVDLLMIVAALGAASIGAWEEGAVLLFLFSLSNALQDYALDRTREAIRSLMELRPTGARVMRKDGVYEVPLEEVEVGETILVKPGERLPLDGLVLRGSSHLDQSPITGESIPVYKEQGEMVFAGSINQEGSLEIRVTQRVEDTTLAKIIHMVEESRAQKARTERWIERFEQYYAMVVIGGAVVIASFPWLFWGWSGTDSFYLAMTLLVVASPCALVISAPAASLSTIAHLARRGILIKGGIHLEGLASIKAVAFDKTGTLTEGNPQVQQVIPAPGVEARELLHLVASVESLSEHPLGRAITAAAREQGIALAEARDLQAVKHGIVASVGKQTVGVGNLRFFQSWGKPVPPFMQKEAEALEAQGNTVIGAHDGTRFLGLLAIRDRIRSEAREAIAALRRAGIEHTVMLSGDNNPVVAAIAQEAGVDAYYGELFPEDKVTILRELEERWGTVAMVGDGINDAPALTVATTGIAMGAAGSDVALETADVVLMSDNLMNVPYAIHLSRRTRRVVWQNITFSLGVIALLISLALGGKIGLSLGVLGHEGSTIVVVSNALRLLGAHSLRHFLGQNREA